MKNSDNYENYLSNKKIIINYFQIKTFFIFVITAIFSFSATAQNEIEKPISNQSEYDIYIASFNLPPGAGYYAKNVDLIDYSFMLEQIPAVNPEKFINDDFLKVYPKEKLDYWKSNEPNIYQYYATAKNFYDNLSSKVKSVLSVEVLWHIYIYDQKLKNKLEAIK